MLAVNLDDAVAVDRARGAQDLGEAKDIRPPGEVHAPDGGFFVNDKGVAQL